MHALWLRMLLGVLLLGAGAYIFRTADALPAVVATQFGAGGRPVSWMSRDGYRVFMLCFAVGVPLLIVAMVTWLPRRFPGRANIPNRTYWFAPERRDASLAYLHSLSVAIACLVAAFIAGLHWLIVRSNATLPPRLDGALLFTLIAVFLAAQGWCIVALVRRFAEVARRTVGGAVPNCEVAQAVVRHRAMFDQ